MDMFRTFFEKSEVDTSVYFQDKKIWACGEKYREFQGKYPVIFITFKDVKFETWQENFGNNCSEEQLKKAAKRTIIFHQRQGGTICGL